MPPFHYNESDDTVLEQGVPVDDSRFKADITFWDDKDRILFVVRHIGHGLKKYFYRKPFDPEYVSEEIVKHGRTVAYTTPELRAAIRKKLDGCFAGDPNEQDEFRRFML